MLLFENSASHSSNKDHWFTITNIMIVRKYEILWELPKCDPKTWSEQMLLEEWHWQTCTKHGCYRHSIL